MEQEEDLIPIEELNIQIDDLEVQLASLTSASSMGKRAGVLGFLPVDPETVVYLRVAGYQGKSEVKMAPPPAPVVASMTILAAAYRESLIDWLGHQFIIVSERVAKEIKP